MLLGDELSFWLSIKTFEFTSTVDHGILNMGHICAIYGDMGQVCAIYENMGHVCAIYGSVTACIQPMTKNPQCSYPVIFSSIFSLSYCFAGGNCN